MPSRRRHRAFIGLGGNLSGPRGGPADYVAEALARLAAGERLELLRHSRFYRSAPWGNPDQDDFINAVAELATDLGPGDLLGALLAVERALGRRRGERWGPRLIDIDLLTFDDLRHEDESLVLPHPRMHERAFVLVPLLELDAGFFVPGKGRADDLLGQIGDAQRVTPL